MSVARFSDYERVGSQGKLALEVVRIDYEQVPRLDASGRSACPRKASNFVGRMAQGI
jgi:hypothetical protein